jgi:hypothetical protein
VLVQHRRIGLSGTKCAFIHLENYDFQEAFLSKTNSFHTGEQGAGKCGSSHTWFSLERSMRFFNFASRPIGKK